MNCFEKILERLLRHNRHFMGLGNKGAGLSPSSFTGWHIRVPVGGIRTKQTRRKALTNVV